MITPVEPVGREERTSRQKLSVVIPTQNKRARSPVTVQEWVAALPDHNEEEEEREDENKEDLDHGLEESQLVLGAEAGYETNNMAKLLLQRNNTRGMGVRLPRQLHHSDTSTSFRSHVSNLSHLSVSSSVDSVLQSREADPEEILLNLGFGGSEQLSRIPARFLRHKSVAKGITVESFLAKQEDIDSMYEFGFAGYRGLHGSPSRRPSEIVEKILQTLMKTDRELRRKNSSQSWSTNSSFLPGVGGIPSRFRMMDPKRKTFQSIVEEVRKPRRALPVNRRTFKGAAQSVLLEKDMKARDDVDEDDELSDNLGQVSELESEDSDWSDDEREELEKMFGAMSERGKQAERRRRTRKSIRKSRRRGGELCGELSRLVFSRDSDTDTLSCDTFCDSSSSVLTFCESESPARQSVLSVSNNRNYLMFPQSPSKNTCTPGVDDDTSSCSYSAENISQPASPPSGMSDDC